jgi:hypothetical protein
MRREGVVGDIPVCLQEWAVRSPDHGNARQAFAGDGWHNVQC